MFGFDVAVAVTLTLVGAALVSRVQTEDCLYNFENSLWLNEIADGDEGGDLKISGRIRVALPWTNPEDANDRLQMLQVTSLKISTKGKNGKFHVSHLSDLNEKFLIRRIRGQITNIWMDGEDVFFNNLKRGVASLFQFQPSQENVEEIDASGRCDINYERLNGSVVLKTKRNCSNPHLNFQRHPEMILDMEENTDRKIYYGLNEDGWDILTIISEESRQFSLALKTDIGVSVRSVQSVEFRGFEENGLGHVISATSAEEAVEQINRIFNLHLKLHSIFLEEPKPKKSIKIKSCKKLVNENWEYLNEEYLGTVDSARAFLNILEATPYCPSEEIVAILKDVKNEPILKQLLDVLACTQSISIHKSTMKGLDFSKNSNFHAVERYLWSLSMGNKPRIEFLTDCLNLWKSATNHELKETLLSSVAAMTRKLIDKGEISDEMVSKVLNAFEDGLKKCPNKDGDECKASFLRAYKNLKHPSTKPILLKFALAGSRITSVAAMKAVYALSPLHWCEDVFKVAEEIFYQLRKPYDSTCRTLALDVLLEGDPRKSTLSFLLKWFKKGGGAYEIRKYLLQRLLQLASSDENFAFDLKRGMKKECLYNWNILAPKGMSSALTRKFFQSSDVNATLHSMNEVCKSVGKRNYIGVHLQRGSEDLQIFTMNTYSSGLHSFMWSNDEQGEGDSVMEDYGDDAEEVTAGVELSVFGVHIRPFVFFNGNAELMGHAWSGTASQRTPVFHKLSLLHDHRQVIALGSGLTIDLNILGACSYDLAGQITFSLWNRNAHSLIDSGVGIAIRGSASLMTPWAATASGGNVALKLNVAVEQKLDIISNLDFSGEIALCLQLSQKKSLLKYEWQRTSTVSGAVISENKNGKSLDLPGRTYALNRANNDMCNAIFAG